LPKKSDFKDVSHPKIKKIEDRLNNCPRKVLNFKTPRKVFMANQSVQQLDALVSLKQAAELAKLLLNGRSTSVGRVLLYRILIEIRRHNETNIGIPENNQRLQL
jgi:hypothetical protein